MRAKRRQGIAVVKAQVAVAISISEGDNALAAKRAIRVKQISEALVGDLRLNGVLDGFWQANIVKAMKSSPMRYFIFIALVLGGKNTTFWEIRHNKKRIELHLILNYLPTISTKISWKSVENC